ncbi:MAG TPA: hypothetical protein VIV88_18650 [Gemmatimonadales bacterium]|jgi:hypothetical protein
MTAPVQPKNDALSCPRAEIISEIWQGVAFIEEARARLAGQIRQSPARDAASRALAEANTKLILAAQLLTPTELAQRPSDALELPPRPVRV